MLHGIMYTHIQKDYRNVLVERVVLKSSVRPDAIHLQVPDMTGEEMGQASGPRRKKS